MTKSEQVDFQSCDLVLIHRGYQRQGNSNQYIKFEHSCVYLFGEESPTQGWRYHTLVGKNWVAKYKGNGASELEEYLRNPSGTPT